MVSAMAAMCIKKNEWYAISIKSGTIDNIGIVPVDVSSNRECWITLYPKQRFTFDNVQLYVRSRKQDTNISVVDFGEMLPVSSDGLISDDNIAAEGDIDDIFFGDGSNMSFSNNDIDLIF